MIEYSGKKLRQQGWRRLWLAWNYSLAGLRAAWRQEAAFRQEVLLLLVLAPLGLWLGKSGLEKGLLVGSWLLVMVVELLNSGLEAAVDRAGTEHHPLAGQAKDMGSAAVLLALLQALAIWLLVLFC